MSKVFKLVHVKGQEVGQHTEPQKWTAKRVPSPLKEGKKCG